MKAVCQQSLWISVWAPEPESECLRDAQSLSTTWKEALSLWDRDKPCPSEDSLWPDFPAVGSLVPARVSPWTRAGGRQVTEERFQEAFSLPLFSAKEATRSMYVRVHLCVLPDKGSA